MNLISLYGTSPSSFLIIIIIDLGRDFFLEIRQCMLLKVNSICVSQSEWIGYLYIYPKHKRQIFCLAILYYQIPCHYMVFSVTVWILSLTMAL